MTTGEPESNVAPPKPPFRARLTILLIGAAALASIVLMCLAVLFIALRR